DWAEPGTVRVLLATWVTTDGEGGSEIVSEARVAPVDRAADVRLRSLWVVIGVFERLIGAEPLELAVARAQGGRCATAGSPGPSSGSPGRGHPASTPTGATATRSSRSSRPRRAARSRSGAARAG